MINKMFGTPTGGGSDVVVVDVDTSVEEVVEEVVVLGGGVIGSQASRNNATRAGSQNRFICPR